MKNTITKSIITAVAILLMMFNLQTANAQCGAPPVATPGSIACYGQTTNVTIFNNLLGGPYNIQPMIDYQFPQIPLGAYATNYAQPTYTLTGQYAGTYTVYIVDVGHGNCYDSAVYTISQPAILNMANSFQSPTNCSGLVDAGFTFAGGTAPYTVTYTNDSVNFQTLTTSFATTYTTNLNIGPYAWKLTDANGCVVDQTNTVFGYTASDQAHWYVGMCGVTDSSVEYLTGGNQTTNRNINVFMLGLGQFNDQLDLKVDFGDNSAIQNFSTTVKSSLTAFPVSHTYTTTGVFQVEYTAYKVVGGSITDSVKVVEFINNNSDVYPGDANGDGFANNVDLLNVGIGFGSSGVVRPGASLSWTAQPCTDWTQSFNSGLNYKHADCDGNGTVGYSDTTAIILNYGQSHVMKLGNTQTAMNPNDPTLAVDFPAGNYPTGSTVTISVNLGTSAVPANNIYGIAFTVNYPLNAFDGNTLGVDFSNCFIGTVGTNATAISKNFPVQGAVDIAVSRINQTNISGYGTVCELSIITIDNVSGKLLSLPTEYITLSNVTLIDSLGNLLNVNTQQDSVTINSTVGITEQIKLNTVSVYPNPAGSNFNVGSDEMISELIITDLSGREIMKSNPAATSSVISTENFEKGIYIVKVKTETSITSKIVEIVK